MKRLYWCDPEPIEGNDYLITEIDGVECNTFAEYYDAKNLTQNELPEILNIKYGGGYSEAEVTADEIVEVDVEYKVWSIIEEHLTFDDGEEDYITHDQSQDRVGIFDSYKEAREKQFEISDI